MYGAIIGDIVGSPFEFDRGDKTKNFELLGVKSGFTDDSVMTIAVGEALLDAGKDAPVDVIKELVIYHMKRYGRKYPDAGYGGRFGWWLMLDNPEPYNSYGNGSAMRVSAAGWLYDSLERTREVARATAEVTHNHPEGIKGAEATASAIYMARTGSSKNEIKEYIIKEFQYDLSRSCDEIRPNYYHVESCQETVPEAITAFMEGEDFEDVIRTAVSLGGDCDTLTAIAGSIAEAYYGVPELIRATVVKRLPDEFGEILSRFEAETGSVTESEVDTCGNELIGAAIMEFYRQMNGDTFAGILNAIHVAMKNDGQFIIPVETPEELLDMLNIDKIKAGDIVTATQDIRMKLRKIQTSDGKEWLAAFTNMCETLKGPTTSTITQSIEHFIRMTLQMEEVEGVIINPWDNAFSFDKDTIKLFFEASKNNTTRRGIYLEFGDITKLNVDCIVNAANKSLCGGGGVDGAIHRAAGPGLLQECRGLNGCETGEAKITKGYNLPAKYVIHTVGPIYSGNPMDERHLHSCYYNSLDLAKKHDIHSIAFPAISTGAHHYPLRDSVCVAMKAISAWMADNKNYEMVVIVCCFDRKIYNAYDSLMEYCRSREV